MTAQQIANLALSNTHTKSTQITDANLLLFLNLARHDLAQTIIKDVNENFFFQIWTIDAQDNTNTDRANGEYIYPASTSSQAGMQKLMRLLIKGYSTDENYTPAREVDPTEILKYHDWAWYMENQPKSDPIYFVADESIFIAPEFKAADLPDSPSGNAQIKLYGIATLADITIAAAESAILIPKDYHEVIALGMEKYIYKARGKKKEAFDSMTDYERSKQEVIDKLTNRDQSYFEASLPNDRDLQYGE